MGTPERRSELLRTKEGREYGQRGSQGELPHYQWGTEKTPSVGLEVTKLVLTTSTRGTSLHGHQKGRPAVPSIRGLGRCAPTLSTSWRKTSDRRRPFSELQLWSLQLAAPTKRRAMLLARPTRTELADKARNQKRCGAAMEARQEAGQEVRDRSQRAPTGPRALCVAGAGCHPLPTERYVIAS